MSAHRQTRPRMTFEEFIAWAAEQPETAHSELHDGEVIPVAPEREAHAYVKSLIGRRLGNAIEAKGLPCSVYVDDFVVRVPAGRAPGGGESGYEPDVLVRCGPRPDPAATWIDDPTIVVEVLSRSTGAIDKTEKLAGYMQLPSLRHYLIVDVARRTVVHHLRDAAGAIATRVTGDAPILLDPPGIVLERFLD